MELLYALLQLVFFLINMVLIASPLFFLHWFDQKIKNRYLIPVCVLLPFITFGSGLFVIAKLTNIIDVEAVYSGPILFGVLALWNAIPMVLGHLIRNKMIEGKEQQVGVSNEL